MQQVLWVVLVLLAVVAVVYSIVGPARNRHREATPPLTGPEGTAAEQIESAEAYRNHLAMARWIELQMKDDLVRSSVPDEEQARARRLLDEFYGEGG